MNLRVVREMPRKACFTEETTHHFRSVAKLYTSLLHRRSSSDVLQKAYLALRPPAPALFLPSPRVAFDILIPFSLATFGPTGP